MALKKYHVIYKQFTVVLINPERIEGYFGGHSTWRVIVPEDQYAGHASVVAKREAATSHKERDGKNRYGEFRPDEYRTLLVFEGHHEDCYEEDPEEWS